MGNTRPRSLESWQVKQQQIPFDFAQGKLSPGLRPDSE
jgi:hypothetical protein